MRRPLFGNGLPRNLVKADGSVTVLDTEELDENVVYALTLFLWIYQEGAGPFTLPGFGVSVNTDAGPSVLLGLYTPTYLATLFVSQNGPPPIEPIKVLDKYMVRGKQKVVMANVEGGSTNCFVWGYFEAVGEPVVDEPFRGLQPSKLVDPFAYAPAVADILAGNPSTSVTKVLHKLDPKNIDLVTLDVICAGGSDDGSGFGAGIVIPNGGGGVIIPMPSLEVANTGLIRNRVFDGIPMLALGPAANQSEISLIAEVGADASAAIVSRGYGSFRRIG